jgi:hypothetical protein
MKASCVVVIPIYTLELSRPEKASLLNCVSKLRDYDLVFLHKQSLDMAAIYRALESLSLTSLSCRAEPVEDKWLQSVESYNALLFQGWFYRLFHAWDYLLIHQLDAWVLRTDLGRWIEKGYTYIGAPWTRHLGPDTPDMGVGNGGFSLRCVAEMIRICDSFQTAHVPVFRWGELAYRVTLFRRYHFFPYSQWPSLFCKRLLLFLAMSSGWRNTLVYYAKIGIQEDHLISVYAPSVFGWMRIPPLAEAAEFAVETNPRQTFAHYQIRRPFGCHAWEKHDRDFWLASFPEEFGHAIG